MFVTEDQAKEKKCPYKVGAMYGAMYGACIASDCMAWRWHSTFHHQDTGHCGLAGDPLKIKPEGAL